jgi:urease accessory protein
MTSWIVLQLADSAFPTGGFTHSAGLEACLQSGEVRGAAGVERFADELIDQLARGSLPMVAAVHDAPERLIEVDAFARATLWSHVARRASTTQGRALLDVAARSFDQQATRVDERVRQSRGEVGAALSRAEPEVRAARRRYSELVDARAALSRGELEGHLAPAFGFITRVLGVERDEALATFLHLGARGVLSAAVRLGAIGPTESQAMHLRLHPRLAAALTTARSLGLDDVAQPSPIIELIQTTQDRLYSRLFQS